MYGILCQKMFLCYAALCFPMLRYADIMSILYYFMLDHVIPCYVRYAMLGNVYTHVHLAFLTQERTFHRVSCEWLY